MRKVGDLTPFKVFMEDSADAGHGKTGVAAPTVYYSKPGAASSLLANPTWSEIDAINMPGWYHLTPSASMVNTAGDLGFSVTATGCEAFNGLVGLDATLVSEVKADTASILSGLLSVNDIADGVWTNLERTLTQEIGVELTPEQAAQLSIDVTAAVSSDLVNLVVSEMLATFTPQGHVVVGRGRGSVRFIDQISDGMKGVRGVTVKAYASSADSVDWSKIVGMDTTDGSGNYLLWLDPGTYVCSIERAGVQLTTIDITVVEPEA